MAKYHFKPHQHSENGDFSTAWIDVIGGLAQIDMVIGAEDAVIFEDTAQKLDGSVTDHFVHIHIQ